MRSPERIQALVLERQASGVGELGGHRGLLEQTGAVHDGRELAAARPQPRDLAIRAGRELRWPAVAVDPPAPHRPGHAADQRGVAERVSQLVAEAARRRRLTKVDDQPGQLGAHAPRSHARPGDAGGDQHERGDLCSQQRAIRGVVGQKATLPAVQGAGSE